MRMWMIDPKMMCRKHLLGEHVECHMFLGTLKKNVSVLGYIRNNLFEAKSLRSRHDELAQEMTSRGYRHLSDFEDIIMPMELLTSKVDVEKAAEDLFGRCSECCHRREDILLQINHNTSF